MSSLSLSRVLQPRRTSLEVQRENFEKLQNQSINKAVNSLETPVKEKHVRSTIIGTFYEKGASTFWIVAQRLPLEENRIVAWKFCHVLHKVLREGHYNCLQQSQRHKELLKNLGKLWVHLKDGYGKLIQLYTTLLITKINFHERNPNFPGNLQLTSEELTAIGGNDINNYFQLTVEMFDYLDDVLALQGAIFNLFEHTSSMTSSGQCRLAPLIPCIQDSNQLYDFSVKLLFKLHTMLPSDTLSGHRDRFLKQFKLLKKFYTSTDNMQYFKNLISSPSLPEFPPNFLIQSELTLYRPPVVVLPPEEQFDGEAEMIANLIDTSDNGSQIVNMDIPDHNGTQGSASTAEFRDVIDNLQTEITRLRNEKEGIISEFRATVASMNDQIMLMENKNALARLEMEKFKEQYHELQAQLSQPVTPVVDQVAEEKVKVIEEKYGTLKSAYLPMRDEHIKLLRQHAETVKQVGILKKLTTEQELKSETMQTTINQLNRELSKITETHVQSSKSEVDLAKQEVLILKEKFDQERDKLNNELIQRLNELKNVKNEMEVLIKKYETEKTEMMNSCEKAHQVADELKQDIESLKTEKQDLLQQKQVTEDSLEQFTEKVTTLEKDLNDERDKVTVVLWSLMRCGIKSASEIIKCTIDEFENPAISSLQCGPDYFRSLLPLTEDALKNFESSLKDLEMNRTPTENVAVRTVKMAHLLSSVIIQGVALSNTSKDIVFGERIAQECKNLANVTAACIGYVELLDSDPKKVNLEMSEQRIKAIRDLVESIAKLAGSVGGQDIVDSSDSVESELANMDKTIEEAEKKIEEMLRASRAADSGVKLEVNGKILDACTSLMAAVKELVKKARDLQAEVVSQGKGSNTTKEFYKRNHQWTDGLISAAKAVALGANLLLGSADKLVTGDGKLEHVMVASQEIAASTAQLVVASRVRAARGSSRLQALSVASRAVSSATGAVIATAKSCSQLVEDTEIDISGVSLQAGRRMEMESQVRVLELEQALATERLKLSALRRTNYRLADSDIPNRS